METMDLGRETMDWGRCRHGPKLVLSVCPHGGPAIQLSVIGYKSVLLGFANVPGMKALVLGKS